MNVPLGLHRWLAFGAGAGIEIAGPPGTESLRVVAVRVRPGRVRVLGELTVADPHQAAGTWGTDCTAFLRKFGLGRAPVTVLLPRRDVIVRQIVLPGVADRDLASAIEFQIDGLHPYADTDAVTSWARLPGTSSILVAITRRAVIERWITLFAEAGIKIGSFSCSAAAVYAVRRLFGSPERAPGPSSGIIAYEETESGAEIYGESAARPVFSALFDAPLERACALAAAEMRIDSPNSQPLAEMLGMAPALAGATAAAAACPFLSLPLNLLPEGNREHSSRAVWIASTASGITVLALAGALSAFPRYEDREYLKALSAEIAKVQPLANRSVSLDAQITTARSHIAILDDVRRHSKADMDALGELTRILPPPTWINLLELNRSQVTIAGETPQTAPLLQVIDSSPLFDASEFAQPPVRAGSGEAFRIRAKRVAEAAQ